VSDLRIAAPAPAVQSLSQAEGARAVRALRGAQGEDKSAKIDKAARDFESILVGQWLEKAEKSFATVPGTDPDQDNDSGHDQFQSIACQSLAQGLSRSGGFGIAAMLSKQLHADANRNEAAADGATGNPGHDSGNVKLLK